jgi:hypothetical protein
MAKTKPTQAQQGRVPPRPSTQGRRPAPKQPAAKPAPRRPSAHQAAQQRRHTQRMLAIAASALVVIVVAVLVIVKATGGSSSGGENRTAATPAALTEVTSVPVSAMVQAAGKVSSGTINPPTALPANVPPLTSGGHPLVLYVGAEYCPYCAAERWAMVMALSKFGTFQNLGQTTSSSTDVNADTPTFSFYGATYSSPYITAELVEQQTRTGATLQKPTAAQEQVLTTYDKPPYVTQAQANGIPFIDLGGKFVVSGTEYDGSAIAGKTMLAAAVTLTSGTNSTSQAALAVAGHLVGTICALTHDQPSSVCSQVPASLKQGTTTSGNQGSSGS